jgi:heme/copper-type cytochrome/quinol oxidase subunit 4
MQHFIYFVLFLHFHGKQTKGWDFYAYFVLFLHFHGKQTKGWDFYAFKVAHVSWLRPYV